MVMSQICIIILVWMSIHFYKIVPGQTVITSLLCRVCVTNTKFLLTIFTNICLVRSEFIQRKRGEFIGEKSGTWSNKKYTKCKWRAFRSTAGTIFR